MYVEAQKCQTTPDFARISFSVLFNAAPSVYIIHLRKEKVVEHVVIVYKIERLILDNTEKYPIRLTADLLHLYGGPETSDLQVANVHKVVDRRKSYMDGSSSK